MKIVAKVLLVAKFAAVGLLGAESLDTDAKAAREIVAGRFHTCALDTTADVVTCWGNGNFGQLGYGGVDNSAVPRVVPLPPGRIASIHAGNNSSCAIQTAGRVYCWGEGSWEDASGVYRTSSPLPLEVVGFGGRPKAIAAGERHRCAVLETGEVECWGARIDGSRIFSPGIVPVTRVGGLPAKAVAVTAGADHSCALGVDGVVMCWGDNSFGALGTGDRTGGPSPRRVVDLDNDIKQIAASFYFNCALSYAGTVKCWGDNSRGGLGTAVPTDGLAISSRPVTLVGLSGVTELYASLRYMCARSTDQVLRCWGDNLSQPISPVPSTTFVTTPTAIPQSQPGATGVALGTTHLCEIVEHGVVNCWGYTNNGNLGNGDLSVVHTSRDPVRVIGTNIGTSVEFTHPALDYHFITSRASDIALLDAATGWQRSGSTFNVLMVPQPGVTALSRFYFDRIARAGQRGTHFYTSEAHEKDLLRALNPTNASVARLPFDEGIDSYVFPLQPVAPDGSLMCAERQVPVYRAFRGPQKFPDDANHRFTRSQSEYQRLVAAGWDGEGVKFCVPE